MSRRPRLLTKVSTQHNMSSVCEDNKYIYDFCTHHGGWTPEVRVDVAGWFPPSSDAISLLQWTRFERNELVLPMTNVASCYPVVVVY